jgi:hypothetical protein
MTLRNRIATGAVTLSALAFVVPVAGASAATTPASADAYGQAGLQNSFDANMQAAQTNLQAAQDAWNADAQAGLDSWSAGAKTAQDGISAGISAAQAAYGSAAQALGIPVDSSGNIG